ncbi:hypothetical protein ACFFQF_16835 [Haladaptatus pallidirubidus]|uniref:hypothetical protein n=1 Tax=Haladaptatus pallidirubidus TaxID=1008152 RepID=UPI0035E60436
MFTADQAGVSISREPPDTHSHDFVEEAADDERSPIVTANTVLTLLKQTGIG